jgi:hypothetical protein
MKMIVVYIAGIVWAETGSVYITATDHRESAESTEEQSWTPRRQTNLEGETVHLRSCSKGQEQAEGEETHSSVVGQR